MALLSLVSATNWIWFSPIADASASKSPSPPVLVPHPHPHHPYTPASTQFAISLSQVNWLANSGNLIFLPFSIVTPLVVQRWGIRTAVGGSSRLPITLLIVRIVYSRRALSVARFLGSLCRGVRPRSLTKRQVRPLDRWPGKSGFRSPFSFLGSPQLLAGVAQPVYQTLGPKYSETWFNLQGRTTATMLLAIGTVAP
jgi:FLVCR family MFS transporter 7